MASSNDILFADALMRQSGVDQSSDATPSLTDAILETDSFLRNFGITDNTNTKEADRRHGNMDVDNLELFNTAPSEATTSLTTVATFCTPAIPIMSSGHKKSPNTTPTNASPGVTTPKTSSSPTNQPFNKFTDPKFID